MSIAEATPPPVATGTIRLMSVFHNPIDRAGVAEICEGDPDILELNGITSIREAIAVTRGFNRPDKKPFDVLLCDYEVPGECEPHPIAQFVMEFRTPVLVFTAYDAPRYMAAAMTAGASGYLTMDATRQELLDAIRTVAEGGQVWTPRQLRQIPSAMMTPPKNTADGVTLTNREMQVMRCIVDGDINDQIAKRLDIGYETAKEHVQHILRKLNLWTRTQAAMWAVRHGVVD